MRLVVVLVKQCGSGSMPTKITLLNKVLRVLCGLVLKEEAERGAAFHQLPFHRMLILLFLDLTATDELLKPVQPQIIAAFCKGLEAIGPELVPGFVFAWWDIVGHRTFIHRVLLGGWAGAAWPAYTNLLTAQLRFLAPFLLALDMPPPVARLYRGTLRVLLVLLHDFPEFIVAAADELIEAIPPNAVQLRNLLLSASPRGLRLPDPLTDGGDAIVSDGPASSLLPASGPHAHPFSAELHSWLQVRSFRMWHPPT